MSLLGISPTQTVLDQREIDWKNAKLIGNGATAIFSFFIIIICYFYYYWFRPGCTHAGLRSKQERSGIPRCSRRGGAGSNAR
jgi:hypothetical protein